MSFKFSGPTFPAVELLGSCSEPGNPADFSEFCFHLLVHRFPQEEGVDILGLLFGVQIGKALGIENLARREAVRDGVGEGPDCEPAETTPGPPERFASACGHRG